MRDQRGAQQRRQIAQRRLSTADGAGAAAAAAAPGAAACRGQLARKSCGWYVVPDLPLAIDPLERAVAHARARRIALIRSRSAVLPGASDADVVARRDRLRLR